ncbi:MAG: transposase, partial [Actinomycetota bacterium]|nr:transposase [Actinomycetota bacterium]
VDMRARLARSERPDRIRDVTIDAAREAGLVGVRRMLDSTPLYDAVATMDTVALVRSALRSLLKAADDGLEAEFRSVISSRDDYASTAKPQIDWDDQAARDELIDSRARDALACLAVLDGREVSVEVTEAALLVASVVGQDLEEADDGTLRIARKVAADRVISTVDSDARHGHKSAHRGLDGYKGHVSVDPDSEIIVASTVTAGNAGDASAADELLAELIDGIEARTDRPLRPTESEATVYGDSAYGTGELLERLGAARVDANIKVQPPVAAGGKFTKDDFSVDLETDTVTCPNGVTVPISWTKRSGGTARFADACATCPLGDQCTNSPRGRTIHIGDYEVQLAAARARRRDPDRAADYRATRPRSNANSATSCAAATEADESGCAANDESPPTSTSSSPPPTWRAWPFSACALRQRADGRQPDEDDGAVPTRCFHPPWRRSHRHRLPSPATPRPPPPRRNPKQGAADATRHQPRGPHQPLDSHQPPRTPLINPLGGARDLERSSSY